MGQPIKQGEIFLAGLSPVKGHEQGGFRPVIVLQNNYLNEKMNTIIVAPLTKNLAGKGRVTTHFLAKKDLGVQWDSLVLLFQMRAVDKSRLQKKIGQIEEDEWKALRSQLAFVF